MPAPISAASAAGAMDADGNDAADSHHPAQRKAVVNFYELLGVAKDASEGDIKKAYKKKSLKLHPDKNPDDPDAERKFAELSQAYTTLLDPVKRIDHNKELAGGDVGWGFNLAAAQERAKTYQWNGDDLVFNLGAQMHKARQSGHSELREHALRCAKFWAVSVVVIAVLEALVVVTALSLGMPKACAIWGAILGTLLLLGVVVSIKTDDWTFPGGTMLVIVALVALLGGLIAADLLVQSKWLRTPIPGDKCTDDIDAQRTGNNLCGIYRFKEGTVVDRMRAKADAADKSICVAPIVPKEWVGTPYALNSAHYWAVDSGCCPPDPNDAASCSGWGEDSDWREGIHWYKADRPSTVFLTHRHLDWQAVDKAIKDCAKDPNMIPVPLQWLPAAQARVSALYDAPAWTWLVVVTLLWPFILTLLWVAVTLGSCVFLPRMHCHQPLTTFCLYVGSGCPSCWSELDILEFD